MWSCNAFSVLGNEHFSADECLDKYFYLHFSLFLGVVVVLVWLFVCLFCFVVCLLILFCCCCFLLTF